MLTQEILDAQKVTELSSSTIQVNDDVIRIRNNVASLVTAQLLFLELQILLKLMQKKLLNGIKRVKQKLFFQS